MATIYHSKDFHLMPWKNGGGSTLELIKIPDPDDEESFLFRLSIAQVQSDGPFSIFPGIDRCLMLLKGNGFQLHFKEGEKIHLHSPFEPIFFQGEKEINCSLIQGPCTDFNVMVKRNWRGVNIKCIFSKKNQHFQKQVLNETYLYFNEQEPTVIHLEKNESFTKFMSEDCWMIEIEIYPKSE